VVTIEKCVQKALSMGRGAVRGGGQGKEGRSHERTLSKGPFQGFGGEEEETNSGMD